MYLDGLNTKPTLCCFLDQQTGNVYISTGGLALFNNIPLLFGNYLNFSTHSFLFISALNL